MTLDNWTSEMKDELALHIARHMRPSKAVERVLQEWPEAHKYSGSAIGGYLRSEDFRARLFDAKDRARKMSLTESYSNRAERLDSLIGMADRFFQAFMEIEDMTDAPAARVAKEFRSTIADIRLELSQATDETGRAPFEAFFNEFKERHKQAPGVMEALLGEKN